MKFKPICWRRPNNRDTAIALPAIFSRIDLKSGFLCPTMTPPFSAGAQASALIMNNPGPERQTCSGFRIKTGGEPPLARSLVPENCGENWTGFDNLAEIALGNLLAWETKLTFLHRLRNKARVPPCASLNGRYPSTRSYGL